MMSFNTYLFTFSFLIICFSCTNYDCDSRKEGYREIWSFAKKIHRERQWGILSLGGNYGDPHLKQMHVEFVCDELVDLERARRLLIQGIEDFLDDINANQRFRPYLPTNPLTYRHLFFGIRFRYFEQIPPAPYIAYAFLLDGKTAVFSIDDPIHNKLENIHIEPFEDTLRIISKDTQLRISPLDEQIVQTPNAQSKETTTSKG